MEYMHLQGADDVRQGGNAVRDGAREMQSAVANMDAVVDRMLRGLDDFANRMESLRNPQPTPLQPCEGCRYSGKGVSFRYPDGTSRYDADALACRVSHVTVVVDGLGCGEREP